MTLTNDFTTDWTTLDKVNADHYRREPAAVVNARHDMEIAWDEYDQVVEDEYGNSEWEQRSVRYWLLDQFRALCEKYSARYEALWQAHNGGDNGR